MPDDKNTFRSNDPESQEAQAAYHQLIGSIERRMDPKSNTVLVVDDSRLIRRAVTRSITENDNRIVVLEAENGQEALDRLNEMRETYEREPLFIVADLEMPVMDGWEMIEQLRKDYEKRGETQGIPVIVLSSSTGEKGSFLFRKSVHGDKSGYSPLVTVAKEACLKPGKYDGKGERGLAAWIRHFLRYSGGQD